MADLVVTAANVIRGTNATVGTGDAGETITAGQCVYKDTTDLNKYKRCDNSAEASARIAGIALSGASNGQPISFVMAGDVNPGAVVTVGEIYLVSTTAGGIAPEADVVSTEYVSIIGVGTTASNIQVKINISGKQVP